MINRGFFRVTPDRRISASGLNEVIAEVERQSFIYSGCVQSDGSGVRFYEKNPDTILGQITAVQTSEYAAPKYSWVEYILGEDGLLSSWDGELREGTPDFFPAYEVSGRADVPVDGSALVLMWPGKGQYWLFEHPASSTSATQYAVWTSDQTGFTPGARTQALFVSSPDDTTPVILHSIAGGYEGRTLYLHNYGASTLTLRHDTAESGQDGRKLWLGLARDVVLYPGEGFGLRYFENGPGFSYGLWLPCDLSRDSTWEAYDGSPSYSNVVKVRYDEADGLYFSEVTPGTLRMDLLPATGPRPHVGGDTAQAGIVSTATQVLPGHKIFPSGLSTDAGINVVMYAGDPYYLYHSRIIPEDSPVDSDATLVLQTYEADPDYPATAFPLEQCGLRLGVTQDAGLSSRKGLALVGGEVMEMVDGEPEGTGVWNDVRYGINDPADGQVYFGPSFGRDIAGGPANDLEPVFLFTGLGGLVMDVYHPSMPWPGSGDPDVNVVFGGQLSYATPAPPVWLTLVSPLVIDDTDLKVLYQQSITADGSGLKLVNDESAPGNLKLYGTNGSGTKGWYDQPASGGGSEGSLFPEFITPVNDDFTWVNQGDSTVTVNGNGGVFIRLPADGAYDIHLRVQDTPTVPYEVEAYFLPAFFGADTNNQGIWLRNSANDKLLQFGISSDDTVVYLAVNTWTNETTLNGTTASLLHDVVAGLWLKIEDDGTDRIFWYSADGYNWIEFTREANDTFLEPNQIGWGGNCNNGSVEAGLTLLHWNASSSASLGGLTMGGTGDVAISYSTGGLTMGGTGE